MAAEVTPNELDAIPDPIAVPEVKKETKTFGPEEGEENQEDLEALEGEELEEGEEPEIEFESSDEEPETEPEEELVTRTAFSKIQKEFPEFEKILKKYPEIRAEYYRAGQYSQIFPTVEVAKEASEKADSLDKFNELLMGGSTDEVFRALGKEDPDALAKVAKSVLPTLKGISEDLFLEAAVPLVNTVIRRMFSLGQKNKDNNQMSAAKILAHFMHGSYDIPEAEEVKKDPELEKEREKFENERRQDQAEKFEAFEGTVHTRTRKFLVKHISEGLDPGDAMSDFVKNKIIDDVIDKVGTQLQADKDFQNKMKKLWKGALTNRLSNQSADSIISAFLSRAKQLIPAVRSKVKAEAMGRKSGNNGDRREVRKEGSSGRNREPGVSRTSEGRKDGKPDRKFWKENSDLDILNS